MQEIIGKNEAEQHEGAFTKPTEGPIVLPDFDGDGLADTLFGRVNGGARIDLGSGGSIAITSPIPDTYFAQFVESGGDFNGDGLSDMMLSSHLAKHGHGHATGSAYVVFGSSSMGPTFDVSALDGTNGFRIDGAESGGRLSWSMGNGGDVNGDGFDDLIVQATDADPLLWREGSTYIIFGRADGMPPVFDAEAIDGINGVRIDNVERRGQAMSAATGDFNGDGLADIAIGAPDRTPAGEEYGPENAYVIFGRTSGWLPTISVDMLDGSNGFRVDGGVGTTDFGRDVLLEDRDGDGLDDLVIAARLENATYIVYGRPTGEPSPFPVLPFIMGTAADDTITGTSGADLIDGCAGNDKLRFSGGGDKFKGGQGTDTVDYTPATSSVSVSLAPGKTNAGCATGDTFLSIERILGTAFHDTIWGGYEDNRIQGRDGNDVISGITGDDELYGDDGTDVLTGGEGKDVLWGGAGADRFVFNAAEESTVGCRDTIKDWSSGDKIDLGDLGLHWIGTAEFSGIPCQLRYWQNGTKTFVEGDVTGDGVADLSIALTGILTLSAEDFVL